MREILGWLRWMFSGLAFWQWAFIFATVLNFSSAALPQPYSTWTFVVGMTIIFGYMFKWFFIDAVKSSWDRYKEDRNKLLTTIKNSDN